MTESRRTTATIALVLAAVLTPAALAPLRSYDFFWHLATGRWITEHRALPLLDPFTLASDRTPWINGEWLFQVALYAIRSITAISWMRATAVAILFAGIFYAATRRASRGVAIVLTLLAFAGAWDRLDARPSTAAAGLLAIAIVLLERNSREADAAFLFLTVLWINVHPSALLAPMLALLFRRAHWLPVASAAALLVNPFGLKGVLAPLELTLFARGGAFVNAEWLPSPIAIFPMLYATAVIGAAAFALSWRSIDGGSGVTRSGSSLPETAARFLAFAPLGYLAIAHVRNQGLYFAALPLLVAPSLERVRERLTSQASRIFGFAAWAIALLVLAVTALNGDHRVGIDTERFPVAAVSRMVASGLEGNIYNPDQFGGYLIWMTYPERRVLTDGRNELYHAFLPEYAAARLDSRAWLAMLAKYRIALAVDEYRPPLDTVNPRTGEHRAVPASTAYWPRRDWALIAYDDAGMVFARRTAFARELIDRVEVKGVVPDAAR